MPNTASREPRNLQRLVLRDASASPGVELMERIAFHRSPMPEDLAIIEAWRPTLCLGVTHA
jgi:hypothetical protein